MAVGFITNPPNPVAPGTWLYLQGILAMGLGGLLETTFATL